MHIVCSHDSVSGTSNTARQIGQMTESMEIGGGGVKKTSRSRYSISFSLRDGMSLLKAFRCSNSFGATVYLSEYPLPFVLFLGLPPFSCCKESLYVYVIESKRQREREREWVEREMDYV